jgi:C4-dicarboxylate-specific signal transduction histidine kinase
MVFKNPSTIRFQLTCLVVACVLPVWLVAGYLVFHAYSTKLHEVNDNMLDTAQTMTMLVDRELTSVQSALLALATSPSFRNGDLADVHRQTLELLKSYPGADIIVADRQGQQLVNSFRSFGTPLPKRNNPEMVRRIFETAKPVVSNLFFGAVTRRPIIGVDVPVLRDGKVIYDLSMNFSSDRMSSILSHHPLPEGWYSSILDNRRVIVARTKERDRFVGHPITPELRRAMSQASLGTARVTNVAGRPVFVTFSQSSMSGWAVAVGVPNELVMAEIYRWTEWAIAGAATILLLGVLLAMFIARRIAQAIQSLVDPALSIGRGGFVSDPGSQSVKETREVAEALVKASELLQRQKKERDVAEHQLSLMIDDLRRETTERLRTMEELRIKEQLLIQQSRHAALGEMIGNIAHQWRQPLNALGLLVQQVPLFHGDMDQAFLDENAAKSMKLIHHMSRTIDDFRDFFKPDKEKVVFRVREEVAKTMSLIEASFQGQQISLEVDAKGDPVVNGYPNEFSQVLLNILINARDVLTEREVVNPKVVITLETQEERAVVTISDNAGGVPEEIIDRIFDPYFTTKGPQTGTGVGLFMSKTIIEKNMSGLLKVRNVNNGAEFRIEI